MYVFLSGGRNKNGKSTKNVYSLNAMAAYQEKAWQDTWKSTLRVERHSHSSTALDKKIFVFCGFHNTEMLSSIEMMDTERLDRVNLTEAEKVWDLIPVPDGELSPRILPVVTRRDAKESNIIFIMGGITRGEEDEEGEVKDKYLPDILTFDSRSFDLQQIFSEEEELICFSSACPPAIEFEAKPSQILIPCVDESRSFLILRLTDDDSENEDYQPEVEALWRED